MNTTVIDADMAIALLERAVQEMGADHVYQRVHGEFDRIGEATMCAYQHDGRPSCIVGHALSYAGVTIEQLREMDEAADEVTSVEALYGDDLLPVEMTDDAVTVFEAAQQAQDNGAPWGEALEAARKAAGL